jgi:hypothetical protein
MGFGTVQPLAAKVSMQDTEDGRVKCRMALKKQGKCARQCREIEETHTHGETGRVWASMEADKEQAGSLLVSSRKGEGEKRSRSYEGDSTRATVG